MINRKNYSKFAFILLFFVGLIANCSVKAPVVSITGEKTALENQIIGTYQQIEEDSYTLASVRSAKPGQKVTISEDKKKVMEAIQGRKFNKDDIDEFKEKGIVGETNKGVLEIRDTKKLETDPELENRVTTIVNNENRYRKILLDRIILLNNEVAKAGEVKTASVFAKLNQDNSPPNTWIQTDDGKWIKKSTEKK